MALSAIYTAATRLLQITWDQNIQAVGSPVNNQLRVQSDTLTIRDAASGHGIVGTVQSATMAVFGASIPGALRAIYTGTWVQNLAGDVAHPQLNIPLTVI